MSIETLSIPATTHGRVLMKAAGPGARVIAAFHGYAQGAEDLMDVLQSIPGSAAFTLVSIQALNRFYTRGDQKIVASWMTRQDREAAIGDNIAYVDRVFDEIGARDIVCLGFSQGVAMAYRAALLGERRASGVIAIGGDIPPDVKDVPRDKWPRVLIAAGKTDHWYTAEKVSADEAVLKSIGFEHEILRYDAGHEITADVLAAAGRFLGAATT